jgi:glucose dehydrogenase
LIACAIVAASALLLAARQTPSISSEAGDRATSFEETPLHVDGTLYLSTPVGRVIALDPISGKQRWAFDAHVRPDRGYGDFTSRGVSTWGRDAGRRIFLATIDARVIALDAAVNTSLQHKARAHAQERSCACRGLRCRCTFGSANH